MNERLKVIVSAYACSPSKGSEPGVGWGFVAALARDHDLWVIVEEEKFRADIEHYLADNPEFTCSVHFIFLRKQRNRALRKLWPPSYYWYYRHWHEDAYHLAQELHREVGFDLAHQLTMVGFREPGYLWKLGIPFVWGPIGGMGLFPWRFLSKVGGYGALYYLGYNLFNLWQIHFSQRPKLAAKAAGSGLIVATPENQVGAERYWGCSSTLIGETGIPTATVHKTTKREPAEPLRMVWTGLHIPRKALNLALAALAVLPKELNWELHVLGKGPRTSDWQRMSEEFGVAECCYFHGWLQRDEAMVIMGSCHLMLITSLRDLTSTVTIEALALGLPIICLDHCGFAGVVDETCGIKVPVTNPTKVVRVFAVAIERLARDERLRHKLANGAVRRAQDFTWDKKAAMVDHIYRQKLGEQEEVAQVKVLLVHNFYGSTAPSGENQVFEAEKALLLSHGHEVEGFTRHSDEIRAKGFLGTMQGALATPWNPWMARALQKKMECLHPDVVHVHNTFPLISPSIFHAIGSRAACVLTLHNYRLFCPAAIPMRQGQVCTDCLDSHSSWPALQHGCYRGSRLATLPLAASVGLHRRLGTWTNQVDAFITLSDFQRKLMSESGLPASRVYVKPNFYPGLPAVVSWQDREPYVVFAGRLKAEKGVESLLRAWRAWGTNAPELRLLGDGEQRPDLERMAMGLPVHFLGQVSGEEAQAQIASAHLLVLPSECFEGFPMVVGEAFAFGTPAAVSNIGPLPTIVQHGRSGVVFSPANPESLLLEIRSVWETTGLLEQLGQGARAEFEANYTEEANYRMLMVIYDDAVAASRGISK